MIVLESTQTLTVTLSATPLVECSTIACFRELGPASSSYTAGAEVASSNGTTPAQVVTPPAAGHRVIDSLTLRNPGIERVDLLLALGAAGGSTPLWRGSLAQDEAVGYVASLGWQKLDAEGRVA